MLHTPGPWDFTGEMCIRANRLADQISKDIGSNSDSEVTANFLVLAAAPDLLHALRQLLAITPGGDGDHLGIPLRNIEVIDAAKQAIARAERGGD